MLKIFSKLFLKKESRHDNASTIINAKSSGDNDFSTINPKPSHKNDFTVINAKPSCDSALTTINSKSIEDIEEEIEEAKKLLGRLIKKKDRKIHEESINKLALVSNGHEYEHVIATILNSLGAAAAVTKGSGDHGVDVIAEWQGIKYGIQTKWYNENTVGNKAAQEALAGSAYWKCQKPMVITNSTFTPAAKDFAQSTGVILLRDSEIKDYFTISNAQQLNSPNHTSNRIFSKNNADVIWSSSVRVVEDGEEWDDYPEIPADIMLDLKNEQCLLRITESSYGWGKREIISWSEIIDIDPSGSEKVKVTNKDYDPKYDSHDDKEVWLFDLEIIKA